VWGEPGSRKSTRASVRAAPPTANRRFRGYRAVCHCPKLEARYPLAARKWSDRGDQLVPIQRHLAGRMSTYPKGTRGRRAGHLRCTSAFHLPARGPAMRCFSCGHACEGSRSHWPQRVPAHRVRTVFLWAFPAKVHSDRIASSVRSGSSIRSSSATTTRLLPGMGESKPPSSLA
jgi:hypothetical protein